jgi:hypothetical protein
MGLHDLVKKNESPASVAHLGPPTNQEQALLDKLAAIPKSPANQEAFGGAPDGYWVFRRFGYTEAENPMHVGIVLAGANPLGQFKCSALVPTALDILKGLVSMSRKMRKRPLQIGIDD